MFDRISSRRYSEIRIAPVLDAFSQMTFPSSRHDSDIDALTYAAIRIVASFDSFVFRPEAIEWKNGPSRVSALSHVIASREKRDSLRRVGDRGMQLCLLGKSGQISVYTVTKRTT